MASETQALLRIVGQETESQTVSVDVLVRLLKGIDRLAVLFGSFVEKRPLQQRHKPTEEVRARYRVRCGFTVPGSYAVPLSIVDESASSLFASEKILPQIVRFLELVSAGNDPGVRDAMPDTPYRQRALQFIQQLVPKRGERWHALISIGGAETVSLDPSLGDRAQQLLARGNEEGVFMTVTGELVAVQFEEFKITIRYPPTSREIQCTYLPYLELDLLDSRRDLIQLTGRFTLDEQGNPTRMSEVSRIEAVDLSAIELDRVEWEGRALAANPPLRLTPYLDEETSQLYVVTDPTLNLHVFASSRSDLLSEIAEYLLFAWEEYALGEAETFTETAKRLGEVYRGRFKELECATV